MRTNKLVLALIIAVFAANTYAAKPPPPGPQDVNVVNTPNVTVTNPQTSVTIDNGSGNPVPVNVQNQIGTSTQSQFVGFTTAPFNGGQGVVTYTNACQQDYPGSWMCTSKEFLESKTYPATTGDGWIRPTFVPISAATGNNTDLFAVHDMSGEIHVGTNAVSSGLACSGWQATQQPWIGLVVEASGGFNRHFCDTTRSVACCSSAP